MKKELTQEHKLEIAGKLANALKVCNKEFVAEFVRNINKNYTQHDADEIKSRAMDLAWLI